MDENYEAIKLVPLVRDNYAGPTWNWALRPGPEAGMAHDFILEWGAVAAIPDGEDSAGRAKLRLQTPEELVQRAIDVATMFYSECKKRGLLFAPVERPYVEEDEA